MVLSPDAILVAILSIFVFLALCAALALVTFSLRAPANAPLIVAAGLVVVALIVVVVSPLNVPIPVGFVIALLGTAVAAIGGDPVTRRVLAIATHGRVREGDGGGILLRAPQTDRPDAGALPGADVRGEVREVMRGGATIGYLERISVVIALIAGFPEALAIIVAVKGVGRFSELAAPESRERFIIGTMSSLLWACVVGALVRLCVW